MPVEVTEENISKYVELAQGKRHYHDVGAGHPVS